MSKIVDNTPGGLGSISRLIKGESPLAAAETFIPGGSFYADAQNKQKQGYETMATDTRSLGKQLKDLQMEGLNKAESYFYPAQAMNRAAYGDPSKLRK
jgi:hypothetical protein